MFLKLVFDNCIVINVLYVIIVIKYRNKFFKVCDIIWICDVCMNLWNKCDFVYFKVNIFKCFFKGCFCFVVFCVRSEY